MFSFDAANVLRIEIDLVIRSSPTALRQNLPRTAIKDWVNLMETPKIGEMDSEAIVRMLSFLFSYHEKGCLH